MSGYVDTYNVCVCKCDHPTYGLVVDRMNMDLKGGIGLGPPSPPLSSSSSSLSSFGGRGSVLAFLLTKSKRVGKKGRMMSLLFMKKRKALHVNYVLTLKYCVGGWENWHVYSSVIRVGQPDDTAGTAMCNAPIVI